jgi:hypothetical protein
MRKAHYYWIAFLIPVVGCAAAHAQSKGPASTVQEMYMHCKSEVATDQVDCISYLRGVADTMMAVQSFRLAEKSKEGQTALAPLTVCMSRVSGGQLEQVFINWAEANPTMWQEPRGYALAALHKTWPCLK